MIMPKTLFLLSLCLYTTFLLSCDEHKTPCISTQKSNREHNEIWRVKRWCDFYRRRTLAENARQTPEQQQQINAYMVASTQERLVALEERQALLRSADTEFADRTLKQLQRVLQPLATADEAQKAQIYADGTNFVHETRAIIDRRIDRRHYSLARDFEEITMGLPPVEPQSNHTRRCSRASRTACTDKKP